MHLDAGMGKRQRHRPSISLSEHMWTKGLPDLQSRCCSSGKIPSIPDFKLPRLLSSSWLTPSSKPPNNLQSKHVFFQTIHLRISSPTCTTDIHQSPRLRFIFSPLKSSFSSTPWCASSPGSVT
ncbi:hypothetical protein AMECASPLE_003894 [Ameca splendens]|uniref:Uncharacterized protein n=1 Tax=Ameca splendens TaxID=208324 RepID=A0ABV0ZKK9_9TELE